MRAKLLFLAKLFIFSLILFALWEAPSPIGLGRWYTFFLKSTLGVIHPILFAQERRLLLLDKVPYYLIPFVSLILSTPKIRFTRRIKLILVGFIVFFAFDFLTTVSGITASIQARTVSSALYLTSLLVLPILLWFIPLYRELEDLWKPASGTPHPALSPKGRGLRDRRCPICGKEKVGLVEHIKSVHGEKALKSWRVRRHLAR